MASFNVKTEENWEGGENTGTGNQLKTKLECVDKGSFIKMDETGTQVRELGDLFLEVGHDREEVPTVLTKSLVHTNQMKQ
jgi:hypothetical protein